MGEIEVLPVLSSGRTQARMPRMRPRPAEVADGKSRGIAFGSGDGSERSPAKNGECLIRSAREAVRVRLSEVMRTTSSETSGTEFRANDIGEVTVAVVHEGAVAKHSSYSSISVKRSRR